MEKHFINTLKLDFEFSGINNENQIINLIRQYFYDEMLPVIENTFEKSSFSENLRIEYLELDLGKLPMNQLSGSLESALRNLVKDLSTIRAQSAAMSGETVVTIPDKKQDRQSTLFYFLQYGYLPWFSLQERLDLPALLHTILAEKNSTFIVKLIQVLKNYDQAISRYINLLTEDSILLSNEQLLSKYTNGDKKFLSSFIIYLFNRLDYSDDNDERLFLKRTFTYVLGQHNVVNRNELIQFLFTPLNVKINVAPMKIPELGTFQSFIKNLVLIIHHLNKKKTDSINAGDWLVTSVEQKKEHLIEAKNSKQFLQPPTGNLSSETHTPLNESCQVSNAGLVLLHPFLPAFFEELKYVKDGIFIHQKTQLRAVRLLHYLATGEQNTPEYLLMLNKLLCAVPFELSVPAKIRVNDFEKNACDQLLDTVIKHWKAIRGTSITGFKTSFLQREAVLKKESGDWLLRIEKKGYDILLDELPWSYSICKLPWNNYLIYTEW